MAVSHLAVPSFTMALCCVSRRQTEFCFLLFKKNSLWHVKSIFLTHFWTLVNKTRKNLVYIVVLHAKLQTQRTKIVEMRGESFLWIKIRCFTPQFLPSDYFFVQDPASMNRRTKPSPGKVYMAAQFQLILTMGNS
jgi:hypothetical protein